ncbi:FAD assembly factor SdhE [Neisseria wadsworthii]|uniref:FAD assembly factor SdhE n=1 Tax=Neisseria wadsworthii TaxID=607711 RepID=UPI000D2F5CAC|nr:succinate dehydrogenase assembly factor 2 [Neisseria wadsworthii]
MVTFDESAKRRIRFLTRRGLLELDILLGRFMETEFQHLSDEELVIFVEILDLPDQEFLALVNQKEQTYRDDFKLILEKIRNA